MSIKIYYQESVVTILHNSQRDQAQGEVIYIDNENVELQTTNLAKKVLNCKHISLVSQSIEDCLASFASGYRVVEAAGGVVINEKGQLLMIYRRGKWDMPKGKREPWEQIEQCAIREVSEECGIATADLTIESKAGVSYHIYEDPFKGDMVLKPSHWFVMRYSGSGELTAQSEEDIVEAIFLGRAEVISRLEDTHKTLVDIIEESYLKL